MNEMAHAQLPSMIDIFFVAAGADYRAYENLRRLDASSCELNHLVVYDFHQRRQPEDLDYTAKYEAFTEISTGNLTIVDVDISDPSHVHSVTSCNGRGVDKLRHCWGRYIVLYQAVLLHPFEVFCEKRFKTSLSVLHATSRLPLCRRPLPVVQV